MMSRLSFDFGGVAGVASIGAILVMVVLKVWLASDMPLNVVYAPVDDLLYVERALHLLAGEAFGPYHFGTLSKYPGISLWLAGTRTVGVPFLTSVDAVYIGAGLYVLVGFRRAGVPPWAALVSFALWLFNPITLGHEWVRAIREPLSTGLFAAMIGAMLHVFVAAERLRSAWLHLLIFSIVFAFSLFLREDDRLLWGLLGLFVLALVWQISAREHPRRLIAFAVAAAVVPAALGKMHEHALRGFVERHYGQPILHDMAEGEFPKLLAAIRSVNTTKDNRLVMAPQEALQKLREVVPAFLPVVDRLPPPGPTTYSCRMHGVCSEWSNGWMPFWIKEHAYLAGLTPSLTAAQAYFRRVREGIERACADGSLRCSASGDGLIPPMELRWTRALVGEWFRLAGMILAPDPHLEPLPYLLYVGTPDTVTKFRAVAMSVLETDPHAAGAGALTREKKNVAWLYSFAAPLVILAGFFAMGSRLWNSDRVPLDPLATAGAVLTAYLLARLAILSYVAVFMGPLVPRFAYSTHAAALLFSVPLVLNAWHARKRPT